MVNMNTDKMNNNNRTIDLDSGQSMKNKLDDYNEDE